MLGGVLLAGTATAIQKLALISVQDWTILVSTMQDQFTQRSLIYKWKNIHFDSKSKEEHKSRAVNFKRNFTNQTEAHFFELPFSLYYFRKLQNLFW